MTQKNIGPLAIVVKSIETQKYRIAYRTFDGSYSILDDYDGSVFPDFATAHQALGNWYCTFAVGGLSDFDDDHS